MAKSKIVTVSIPAEMHEKANELSVMLLGRKNLSAYIAHLIKKSIDEHKKTAVL